MPRETLQKWEIKNESETLLLVKLTSKRNEKEEKNI